MIQLNNHKKNLYTIRALKELQKGAQCKSQAQTKLCQIKIKYEYFFIKQLILRV